MFVAANESELLCMAYLANIERFLCHSNLSFSSIKFYVYANSPASADENQLKCEKVRFLSEMSEINTRLVIFNL